MAKPLDDIYQFALGLYHRPYIYGAQGEYKYHFGMDCSGLVNLILKHSEFELPDMTAQSLYDYFNGLAGCPHSKGLGSLAFFGTSKRVEHVGWMIDPYIMISASGGGSHCNTIEIARRLNAFVSLQPISFYKMPAFFDAICPPYHLAGLRI